VREKERERERERESSSHCTKNESIRSLLQRMKNKRVCHTLWPCHSGKRRRRRIMETQIFIFTMQKYNLQKKSSKKRNQKYFKILL
jgi:hypothetical protein